MKKGRKQKYKIADLEVGQETEIQGDENEAGEFVVNLSSLSSCIYNYGKRYGKKFVIKRGADNQIMVSRIE